MSQGLHHVHVETDHSWAYRNIVYGRVYKVRSQGYKNHEIAEILGLQNTGEKHAEYIIANHINRYIAYFCNSNKAKVQDLNYLDVVSETKARQFVASFYDQIQYQTRVKEKHVNNDEKERADVIFSTVRRCKGMEYDSVRIVDDFITEEKLEKLSQGAFEENMDPARLNEEINLLYVAVTRTRNKLEIPETLLPAEFQHSPRIRILKTNSIQQSPYRSSKASSLKHHTWKDMRDEKIAKARTPNQKAYKPWTRDLDQQLTEMYYDGVLFKDIAEHLGRSSGAIRARVKKLRL